MTRKQTPPTPDHVTTPPTCAETARVTGPLAGGSADVQPTGPLQQPADPPTATGARPHGTVARPRKTFDCPKWPDCACPDGAVRHDCPAFQALVASRFPPLSQPESDERIPTWSEAAPAVAFGIAITLIIGGGIFVAAQVIGLIIGLLQLPI